MIDLPNDLLLCACLGPLNNEPYCPCEMSRLGLPSAANKQTKEESDELQKALEQIFDPSNKNPQVTNRDRN